MRFAFSALALLATAPALAQTPPPAAPAQPTQPGDELVVDVTGGMSAPLGIAIPAMPTSAIQQTAAGSTDVLGRQLAEIIRNLEHEHTRSVMVRSSLIVAPLITLPD